MTKKKVGRKPHGLEPKLKISICLEPRHISILENKKNFPNRSAAVEYLIEDYCKRKYVENNK